MQMVKCASSYNGEGEAASEAVNCCLRYIYIYIEREREMWKPAGDLLVELTY
jgi:hypothetical protein